MPEPRSTIDALTTIDQALQTGGAEAALDALVASLEREADARGLLDALLLKARIELGLPALPAGSMSDLPEPVREAFEERYIEAVRRVGTLLLKRGDVLAAWPYFRLLGEREPVAAALESIEPEAGEAAVSELIQVALQEGANPRRGFRWVLDHYGICSAITAFEHLPNDPSTRAAGVADLADALHAQLVLNLRAEIEAKGEPLPPENTPIPALIAGREWLYDDEGYHVDLSHLAAVVRLSLLLEDADARTRALELTAYGRKLSPRHQYPGDPPFESLYESYAAYLGALSGQEVEPALTRFRAELDRALETGREAAQWPAQVLVRLLHHLGRTDEAIEVAAAHLGEVPDGQLFCPSLVQLCQKAGCPERLAAWARERGDRVRYVAALLQGNRQTVS